MPRRHGWKCGIFFFLVLLTLSFGDSILQSCLACHENETFSKCHFWPIWFCWGSLAPLQQSALPSGHFLFSLRTTTHRPSLRNNLTKHPEGVSWWTPAWELALLSGRLWWIKTALFSLSSPLSLASWRGRTKSVVWKKIQGDALGVSDNGRANRLKKGLSIQCPCCPRRAEGCSRRHDLVA